MSEDIRSGIHRHYKGPLYLVLGLAHDANAEDMIARDLNTGHFWVRCAEQIAAEPIGERIVVVYVPLQLDGAHLGPPMAVRTVEDFVAWVADPSFPEIVRSDGTVGRYKPRFEYLGPELTAEMMSCPTLAALADPAPSGETP